MLNRPCLCCILPLLLLAGAAPFAWAQNVSGSIKGTIIDPAGAAVPGAEVSLVNASTAGVLNSVTNAAGLFVFPSVLAGEYRLRIRKQGFQQYERTGIDLVASEIRDLGGIALSIGESRTTITVVDTAVTLQTASGEKAGVVTGTQLDQLALKGRDFVSLVSLMPGIVDDGSQALNTASRTAFGGVYVNGGRNDMKNFTVDGGTQTRARCSTGAG